MEQGSIREAAAAVWSAWSEQRLIDGLPQSCRPGSLEEGYAIQRALADLAQSPTIGWKIAATSAAGQKHIGVAEPLCGRLFSRFLHEDGAVLRAGRNHMRVAEAEFAFRFGRDLGRRAQPYDVDTVMQAVDRLHLAIEVPDSRYRDFVRAGAPQLLADDSCASLFVLGPEATGWRDVDLKQHPVAVRRNDAPVASGSGANVLGDPRVALAWLVNDRARREEGVKAGQVVTTGTCVVPVPIAPGDRIVADFGELGSVRVSFVD